MKVDRQIAADHATNFTKFLSNAEASIAHLHGDIANRCGTPEQRVKQVNLDICKRPQKFIG